MTLYYNGYQTSEESTSEPPYNDKFTLWLIYVEENFQARQREALRNATMFELKRWLPLLIAALLVVFVAALRGCWL